MSSNHSKRFAGKVVIVTASTTGIGFAIARRFMREGAHVIVSSRDAKHTEAALEELGGELTGSVSALVCHVGKREHREKLVAHAVEKFGGVDILVSNAAVNPPSCPLSQVSESLWDKVMDVNVKSALMLCKLVIPLMTQRGGGSIIFVSSIMAFQGVKNLGPYVISKTALLALTKILAVELASSNIRVNCIAPGLIKTKFSQIFWQSPSSNPLNLIPMKRVGTPDECAGTVAFLASEDADYITGETIVIGGGIPSRL